MKKYSVLVLTASVLATLGIVFYFVYALAHRAELNRQTRQSNLIKRDPPSWKAEAARIGNDKNIGRYYFFDKNVVYGISYGKFVFDLSRSSDGGKSWEKRRSMTDFGINDIFFTTPTTGFIVLSKLKPSSTPSDNKSFLMQTEDGGLTWKTVYSSDDADLYRSSFDSDGESGILIGDRIALEPASPTRSNLVLITNDKGQTWTDVSENLKNEVPDANDQLTNVFFLQSKEIVALSGRGKILKTTDYGKSWKIIAADTGEPPQTGFGRFGKLENGKFWIAGGTKSIEGRWAVIAAGNETGWDKYRLTNYYFSDVEFLSDKEVIVCGSKYETDASAAGARNSDKAVILYSSNGGQDWETVQEDDSIKTFYSIDKLADDKIFIAGESGRHFVLTRNVEIPGN